jgi:hypothetical protein
MQFLSNLTVSVIVLKLLCHGIIYNPLDKIDINTFNAAKPSEIEKGQENGQN